MGTGEFHFYSGKDWVIAFLVAMISYSHLIPVSIYVAIEIMKMILVYQVQQDTVIQGVDLISPEETKEKLEP